MSSLVLLAVYEVVKWREGMMSSKLVFRRRALEVGGREGVVAHESCRNFEEAVGDVSGRRIDESSRGMSGTGRYSSFGR